MPKITLDCVQAPTITLVTHTINEKMPRISTCSEKKEGKTERGGARRGKGGIGHHNF